MADQRNSRNIGRPFGTFEFLPYHPALKRWAILDCPCGTVACAVEKLDSIFTTSFDLQDEAGGSSFFAEGPLGRSTCGGGTCVAQVMPDCAW